MRFERTTLIVPAAKRDEVNRLLQRQGLGPDNISVPLTNAAGKVTHYAASGALPIGITKFLDRKLPGTVEKSDKGVDAIAKEKNLERKKLSQ